MTPISDDLELNNPNNVKVITDKANNAILDALKSVSLSDLLNPEEFLKTQNTEKAVLLT